MIEFVNKPPAVVVGRDHLLRITDVAFSGICKVVACEVGIGKVVIGKVLGELTVCEIQFRASNLAVS